jgi:ABC-type transport system involved in multi-copper enzyme maturation permease subunit
MCLSLALFCLALSWAAQAVAAAVGRRSVGLAVVAGYAFVSYVVYGLGATVEWLQHLRPLTLWRWYLLDDPLTVGFTWTDVAVLGAVCAAAILLGLWAFARRDLRA